MVAPRVVPPLPILMILGDELKKARQAQCVSGGNERTGVRVDDEQGARGDERPAAAA